MWLQWLVICNWLIIFIYNPLYL